MLSFLWTVIIGFIAGVIAKLVTPGGEYEPKGFILTTILGVVGALTSARLLAGIGLVRGPVSSVPLSVPCLSCSYGELSSVVAARSLFCNSVTCICASSGWHCSRRGHAWPRQRWQLVSFWREPPMDLIKRRR